MLITAKNLRRYKAVLVTFVSYIHGKKYKKNHEFTDEELRDITHEQVLCHFRFLCFGDPNPVFDETLKVKYRKSTVYYWKKSLSYFLSNQQTKSDEMNKLIKMIGQMQVRKMGKDSQARDPLNDSGFQHLLQVLKEDRKDDKKKGLSRVYIRKYGFPAMLCYQFAMIGRVDDCTQLLSEALQVHDKFPSYALKTQISWSKNVTDERDAPFQMLVGSLLTVYCAFVNLGIWLEIRLETTPGAMVSPYVFSFSEDYSKPKGGKKALAMVGRIIGEIFRDDEFYEGEKVGTHSIRKFATTQCRNAGVSHDDVEHRGRWKDSRRVSNRYISPVLPFVDANACLKLCQGGACTYVAKPGCITQEFLCYYVVPYIEKKYGAKVAIILGSAVMWTIFSSHSDMVPSVIRARVMQAYDALPNKLPDGENPIEQRLLKITGTGNNFRLVAITSDNTGTQEHSLEMNKSVGGSGSGDEIRDFLNVNMNQLTEVRQGQIELIEAVNTKLEQMDGRIHQFQRTMTSSINRISRQPHRMMYAAANDVAATVAPTLPSITTTAHPEPRQDIEMGDLARHAAGLHATLSPGPKNLYALWQEWYFGIDGRKPAKDFSPRESGGKQKVTYCNRKKFWLLAEHLIRSGCNADDACKKIYDAYGHDSTVTSILRRIAKDKDNGTIPRSLQ
jgi:hypothetical protein